jgi:alpha-glucosidase
MFGEIQNFRVEDNKVHIQFAGNEGRIEIINPWTVNVFSPLKYKDHYSRAIENVQIEAGELHVSKKSGYIEITTGALIVQVHDHFLVDFYDTAGVPLCLDHRAGRNPFVRRGNVSIAEAEGHAALRNSGQHKIEVVKQLFGDEKFYGLGDKTGHLNKRGYEYEMWNTDDPSPHVESHKSLYKSIPFFITFRMNTAFGIFFDNTFKSYFDMGKENSSYYYFGADDGNLDYYFIAGPQIEQVITRYTALTGTTPLPQLWTLGYHQSRWSYAPESRVMEIANGFREHDIPLDVIHLDVDYMDGYRVFTWDNERFPDPKKTIETLNKKGIKVVTIIDPGVKKDRGYSIYEEGLKKNYYATDKDGIPYVNAVWPGDSVYPDFSDSAVREWWADNQRIMLDAGVSGIWNDMNEPASFNGPLPDDVSFKNDGRPTDHREIHNVYGQLMSKATFEGIKKYTGKRPFVITRACYAGIQKYSTVWTGDNQSFWEHLRMSVPMLLNLGMSGAAYCGCDVGGFFSDSNPELLSRWVQVGCFSPLFRNHSAIGSRDQEPWAFDEETLSINRKYIKLRYQLLPYLYDLMRESEKSGLAPMRPLFLHYPQDSGTHEINDQFLFGSSLLVAPVVEQGKRHRTVYLPEGKWFDYWTKTAIEGGRVILVEAPLDVCPIYVKAGALIPNYPVQNYVGEKNVDELKVDIYPGSGSYLHYQDDGESYGYQEGEYNEYLFTQADQKMAEIRIEKRHMGYAGSYKSFEMIVNDGNLCGVSFNGASIPFEVEEGRIRFRIPAEEGTVILKR